MDVFSSFNDNSLTIPSINASVPIRSNLLRYLDATDNPAVAQIPHVDSLLEGSTSNIDYVDNGLLEIDVDRLIVPNIDPVGDVFVAADFEEFSDTSNDSVQDDNSDTSSIVTVQRLGYCEGIPLVNPQTPVGPIQIPMHVIGTTNVMHYNNLEMSLATSELQRNVICHSVEHKAIADLMMILELAGSPDYLIKHIMVWARDASDRKYPAGNS